MVSKVEVIEVLGLNLKLTQMLKTLHMKLSN